MTETHMHNSILAAWNALDAPTAAEAILPCNGSRAWADQLAALRPFQTAFDLTCTADIVWRALPASDWQQAFDSHQRIGETPTNTAEAALAAASLAYEEKFGRTFIVHTTGRSTEEILAILQHRLSNDPATELREAVEQQRQITQLRLRKWLATST
jgi:2-oxo-4-hydroxy-4-carboxy-5-ureidoimidazoline decarboxylase